MKRITNKYIINPLLNRKSEIALCNFFVSGKTKFL